MKPSAYSKYLTDDAKTGASNSTPSATIATRQSDGTVGVTINVINNTSGTAVGAGTSTGGLSKTGSKIRQLEALYHDDTHVFDAPGLFAGAFYPHWHRNETTKNKLSKNKKDIVERIEGLEWCLHDVYEKQSDNAAVLADEQRKLFDKLVVYASTHHREKFSFERARIADPSLAVIKMKIMNALDEDKQLTKRANDYSRRIRAYKGMKYQIFNNLQLIAMAEDAENMAKVAQNLQNPQFAKNVETLNKNMQKIVEAMNANSAISLTDMENNLETMGNESNFDVDKKAVGSDEQFNELISSMMSQMFAQSVQSATGAGPTGVLDALPVAPIGGVLPPTPTAVPAGLSQSNNRNLSELLHT